MSISIEDVLAELSDSTQPLVNTRLTELNDLSSADLDLFKHRWGAVELKRRRQITSRLVELVTDNIELNFDSIFKYCLGDEDTEVQSRAIEGLWENEEVSLISLLVKLLGQSSSVRVQTAAATALGKFAMLAEHKKLSPLYASRVRESLLAVFNDENRTMEVRRRALEAMAPLSLPEIKAAIIEAYRSDDSKLIVGAIYAMGRNCDPAWLPILLKELASDNAELRYEAAGACSELEDKAAVPDLIRLVDDTDIDVRIAAIQALGKIGDGETKKYLERCLRSTIEAIRQAAQDALEELAIKENPLPPLSGKFEQGL